jgi:transcription termination factor Rho
MRGRSPPSEDPPLSEQDTDSGDTAEKRTRKPRASGNAEPAAEAGAKTPAPAAPADAPQGNPSADAGGNDDGGNDGGRRNPRRERFRNRRDRNRGERGGNRDGMPSDDGGNETFVPRANPQVPEGFPQYSLGDLKRMPAPKLLEIAEQLNIHEGVARARKQDVIVALLKVLTRHGEGVAADGVLEILPDGFGFLRAAEASYLAGPDDTYISPSQIRRFNLRTGDHLSGRIRWPKDGERYFALSVVDTINGEPLEASKNKVLFENLTPLFPRASSSSSAATAPPRTSPAGSST